jgi:F420-dependent oxidoreductase-like protein
MSPFFGYHMPNYTYPGVPPEGLFDHVVGLVQAAEAAGFDLVTVMDHFYQIGVVGPETEPMLEAYTTLGAIAARTSRVRLATMVAGVTYRNPALLAKMVTTLDIISKGRAVLGIGAAWNESEHRGYGFDFPPIGERMDRLEEALTICKRMFTEESPTFAGRYYRIESALDFPRPIQPGGPPILIGGSGERRTLRMVARFGDISNWWGSLDELRHKDEVLVRHCEAEGRDPSQILRTVMAPLVLVEHERDAARIVERMPEERRLQAVIVTPAQAAEFLARYVEAGFRGFVLRNQAVPTVEALGLAGELIRLMAGAPVA